MTRRALAGFVAVLACLGLLLLALPALVSAPADPPDPSKDVDKLTKARFEAAQAAYRELMEYRREKPFDPEPHYVWSKRVLEAQREAARDKKEEETAFKEHLDRMAEVEKKARDGLPGKFSLPYQVSLAVFFRTEAELWLARARAGK